MAIQTGIISYSGKLSNTIGYYRNGKYCTRRLNNNYQLAEESIKSATEFGYGSTAAALTKQALAPLLFGHLKKNLHNRLASIYRKVIRSGPLEKKGKRNVFDGNMEHLVGFELNKKRSLHSLLDIFPHINYRHPQICFELGALTWQNVIIKPDKADRAVLQLGFSFLDFINQRYNFKLAPPITIDHSQGFFGGNLKVDAPDIGEQVVLVMASIYFEKGVGDKSYCIGQELYQGGQFLAAMHIRDGERVFFKEEDLPISKMQPVYEPNLVWELKKQKVT